VRGLLIGPHRSPADMRNAVQRFLCLNVQLDMIIYVFLWIGTASLFVRDVRRFGIPVQSPLDNVNI
jgi:hypothetical protein